ncbi:sensor histidine kinase [Planctobacterium marinum]|uniref:sensor histidine kinase n=1 Tax=Planctobacterium marinum TaxID=1631968 RepID=UPI001E478345|nr:HAMP domain-containing sensor histidine kinase [Planctobacterium marinum]MCC2605931.1 HAMP domain-containing histidine kinase [Planctobacterium marinum]
MIKGIRAQLFFGFGGLVLVISLFYFRLTFLFVEVTQDIIGDIVIAKELENYAPKQLVAQSLSVLTSQDVLVIDDTSLSLLEQFEPSVHNETLYRVNIGNHKGYATKIPTQSGDFWLLVNIEKRIPLFAFSSVFGVFLGSISTGVIILSVLSTWFIASKLSLPIRNLTQDVVQQRRDRACDMKEASRSDEIGQLAKAFEDTYGELQQAWRREHDFASDVSHELRTPVALIRNTLDLNSSDKLKTEDRQLLEQATTTLQATIEVLLALARKENLVFDSIRLLPILERVALSVHLAHPEQPFDIELDIESETMVYGNHNLISLLCQNLINNGFYHGNGRKMRVYHLDGKVVFENPFGTEKSGTYQGLGHGQYLVTRMAHVMEWRILVEHDETFYRVLVSSFN